MNGKSKDALLTLALVLAACTAWQGQPPLAAPVTIEWTAPGDDGATGTAAEYDIRYSTDSTIVAGWTNANQLAGEPLPKPAGSAETHTFALNSGVYFIAMRTRDEAFNWSPTSNIVRATVDGIAPAAILDLRVK